MIKGCILPWIHMHGNIQGKYKVCCFSEGSTDKTTYNLGDSSESPISVWKSEEYQNVRETFLDGGVPPQCESICYSKEASSVSPRMEVNNRWKDYDYLQNVPLQMPKYIDIRFSNICNFKCRMCGPEISTRWAQELGRKEVLIDNWSDNEVLWNDLPKILPHVVEIYFAGGEPLMAKGHLKLLNWLIDNNFTKLRLTYNTNLSILPDTKDFISMWNKFDEVTIWPSCDGYKEVSEYIRTGFDWDTFNKGCETYGSRIKTISSVVNVYSLFSMPKLVMWGKTHNLYIHGTTQINPNFQSIQILSKDKKVLARSMYERFLSTFKGVVDPETADSMMDWIKFMEAEDLSYLSKAFKAYNMNLDEKRNSDFSKTFPELRDWYEQIS